MRILLITSTAREHAIAEVLTRSSSRPQIIAVGASKNPGVATLADEQIVANPLDFAAMTEIAKRTKPDFCIIGPDDPIGAGLADVLQEIGIPSVAPKKSLARVESSKSFTRDLMRKYAIEGLPRFKVFTSKESADRKASINDLHAFFDELKGEYVVKYDALKGGKGVKLSGEHLKNFDEGVAYALECIDECGRVVIEEKFVGVEFSFLSFVSGDQVVDMPAVQDHKRAYEGDEGPNTGGMGTYSDANWSLPFLTEKDIQEAKAINRKIAAALMRECGEPYKGILYGGFIATADGVRVIEYNARFGDPEALNILPLLTSDFTHICQGIIDNTLTENLVSFDHLATVCKYIVPRSYPEAKNEKGQIVTLPKDIPDNVRVYLGDVVQNNDGALLLGGSRSIGVVGLGKTLGEAERAAESACAKVQGPVRYRKDIGTDKMIKQRLVVLQGLRFAPL